MKPKTLTRSPSASSVENRPAKPKQKHPGLTEPKAAGQRKRWKGSEGEKFGRLIMLKIHSRDERGHAQILCRCECGTVKTFQGAHLRSGATRSCGCLHTERVTTHGHCAGGASKLYHAHRNMFDRCFGKNPRHAHYRRKGITVCRRWTEGEGGLSAFECFVKDMGEPPSPLHTVERKNNDGNYTPTNCRWATKLEQQNNTDRNIRVKVSGKNLTLTQICQGRDISRSGMRNRLRKWSTERALTEPTHKRNTKL